MPRPTRIPLLSRARIALLVAVLLMLAALAPSGGVEAQTTPAPSFLRDAFTYTLDEGADGSGTPVAIGAPIVVADAADTTSCAISAQTVTGGSALSPALFAISDPSTCAITYTGSGETRAVGARESFSLTVGVDGNDAGTDADDTIAVTVKIVNAATDKAALEAFYDATGGDNWTVNTNWKSGTLPSDCGDENRAAGCWFAVNTDASGRVTELNFLWIGDVNSPNNFVGSLPAELGDLSRMTHLYLAARIFGITDRAWRESHPQLNHTLTGPIPAELGNLRSLTTLHFGGTNLSGAIPPEFGALPALTDLTLRDNALSGAIPDLSGLAGTLTGLDLSGNLLSGGVPGWLGDMDLLTSLDLQNNELSGAIPATLGDMDALTFLNLSSNQLGGVIPDLSGLADTLTHLTLDRNQLTGGIPVWLVDMDALLSLSLGGNGLTGGIPVELGDMDALGGLYLSGNRLGGVIPDLSALADTLKTLWLAGNGLTGSIPDWLGDMDLLEDLRIHDNQLTGGIPVALGDMDALRVLVLYNNPLGGAIPDLRALADSLQHLHLNHAELTGVIPDWLGGMTELMRLDLRSNALSGRIPRSLTALTDLFTLRLDGNPDLRCVARDETAILEWIARIRARQTPEISVLICPPPPPPIVLPPYASVTLSVAVRGDAPGDAVYGLLLSCGTLSFTPSLAAGQSYNAPVPDGSVCSLAATDSQGAASVAGEFAGVSVSGGLAATLTFAFPEEEAQDEPVEDEQPTPQLEQDLVAGATFVRWRSPEPSGGETPPSAEQTMPVADAVAGLSLRVTAVYWWDAAAQEWRSWFPDGDDAGVNTLADFEPGAIYFVFAEERDGG